MCISNLPLSNKPTATQLNPWDKDDQEWLYLFIVANPCCSHPCQNRGECMSVGFDQYKCDCTRTGFYGENCTIRKFLLGVSSFGMGPHTVTNILHICVLWGRPANFSPVLALSSWVSDKNQVAAEAHPKHSPLHTNPLQGSLEHCE